VLSWICRDEVAACVRRRGAPSVASSSRTHQGLPAAVPEWNRRL